MSEDANKVMPGDYDTVLADVVTLLEEARSGGCLACASTPKNSGPAPGGRPLRRPRRRKGPALRERRAFLSSVCCLCQTAAAL
ncbi:MAG: hypothetical protein M3Y28_11730 [Armatimonadota bacterium]|nr:hypothetical protein [Armatimonadota bacterium]